MENTRNRQGSNNVKPHANRETLKAVWRSDRSYATTLVICFIDTYGTEGLDWDPMTIRSEIEEDFSVKISNNTFNRLMAGINIVTTDQFYSSLPDFIDLCNILDGDILDPKLFDPADPSECAWGITEALFMSPPDEGDENPFSPDIVGYIAEILKSHGINNPPDVLKIALKGGPEEVAETVGQNFSDDPEMYSAIWKNQQEKSEEIVSFIKSRLKLLVGQIKGLSLSNGNVLDSIKKFSENR